MDLIFNGQPTGSVATRLLAANFDVSTLRPWIGNGGRTLIAQNQGGKVVAVPSMVNNATLLYDEWKTLDSAVVAAAQPRLRVVADLRAAGLTYNIPNGMGKTVLMSQNISDIGDAGISMDPTRQTAGDRPEFDLTNLPLPVIHKDFSINARQLAASRNGGSPLDTTTAQLAARKVSEEAEKLALGQLDFTYGGGSIYGLLNFPSRITHTMVSPAASGWTPAATLQDILAMRQASTDAYHYGPWVLYNSPAWDQYLDEDYKDESDISLRARLAQVNGIQAIRTADYLTGYAMLLVQQSQDVIRLVIGMDITTVQWEEMGGLRLNFKVMAILVPQLRADANGNTGIVHGSSS